ncbi:MAG TPA: tetratricopeptide repeat protein [bacterium]|nr:tetratricopeptide repeat protein [bacterium]
MTRIKAKIRINLTLLIVCAAILLPTFAAAQNMPPQQDRKLLAFETVFHEIVLPAETAAIIREAGFAQVTTMLHDDQPVQALNDAFLMALRHPALWSVPAFHLLVAECYFRIGLDVPVFQYKYAKPIYDMLARRYPRWENQPLVLFRLATLNDRQGFVYDAEAEYGLLIDWYPGDPLADHARLGLIMSQLRAGELRDSEKMAEEVLKTAKDAQIIYHASLGLAIAQYRMQRYKDALAVFERSINWPEDLEFLEDYELFTLGEVLLVHKKYERAMTAFEIYLKRFPNGDDAPTSSLYIAENAQRNQQYKDALERYLDLVNKNPDTFAGVKAKFHLAELRLLAFPDKADEETEKLLRDVRDQNDFRELNQIAALLLGRYYLTIGRPLAAIEDLMDVFDNPEDVVYASNALNMMLSAFSMIMAAKRDDPMYIAKVFIRYRQYLDVPAMPQAMYKDLGELLNQNLLADTLLSIARENPLAEAYPTQAMMFRAKAYALRGDDKKAIAQCRALLEATEKKKQETLDPLRHEAHLLWARLDSDRGFLRRALRQLALAGAEAVDPFEKATLAQEMGLILLKDNAPEAATESLSNAANLYGPPNENDGLNSKRAEVFFHLGDALYRAKRYQEARNNFDLYLKLAPSDDRLVYMAKIRRSQAILAAGEKLTESEQTGETAQPKWFWPRGEWSYNDFLVWRQKNKTRFGDTPDWETLP